MKSQQHWFDDPNHQPDAAQTHVKQMMELITSSFSELMKTKEGREAIRRDIAALQGVPVESVRLEGDITPPNS